MTVTATTLRLDLTDRIHRVAVLEDYETQRNPLGPVNFELRTHTVLVSGSYFHQEKGRLCDYLLKATVRDRDAMVLRGFEPELSGEADDFETALFELEGEDETGHPLHRNKTVCRYRIDEGDSLRSGPLEGRVCPSSTSMVLFQRHGIAPIPTYKVGLFNRQGTGGDVMHVLAYPEPGARTLEEVRVPAGDVIAVTPF